MVYVELTPEGWKLLRGATDSLVGINFGMKSLDVDRLDVVTEIIRELRHAYESFEFYGRLRLQQAPTGCRILWSSTGYMTY